MPPIIDSHEDIAWNILTFGRDYTRSVVETRRLEKNSQAVKSNGETLLGWPEWQRGQVRLIFSTLHAAPQRRIEFEWETQFYPDGDYQAAHKLYRAQIDVYRRLLDAHPDKFKLVRTVQDLNEIWGQQPPPDAEPAIGLVLLMEGAEGVRRPEELEEWYDLGLRLIGPAWAGTRYCGGTLEPGPLTKDGFALLEVMGDLGFTLDLSHMDEQAALQALDVYPGPIVATHANCDSLIKDSGINRHLSDSMIMKIAERNGVIGVIPYNLFLKAGWSVHDGRNGISLADVAAHIDHICQLTGTAHHAALGSDFDGGFGLQSVPEDVDSIADLQKLGPLLSERGYSSADIAAIFGENWLNHLRGSLPTS
jgi:membrane dipeptidase